MFYPKDIDWLNGYKNMMHIYDVYKKHTSDLGHKQKESEGIEKAIPYKWNPNKAGVAILIWNKMALK